VGLFDRARRRRAGVADHYFHRGFFSQRWKTPAQTPPPSPPPLSVAPESPVPPSVVVVPLLLLLEQPFDIAAAAAMTAMPVNDADENASCLKIERMKASLGAKYRFVGRVMVRANSRPH